MQKITPFLWFDGCAAEARDFYVSIFRNSKVLKTTHYGEGMPAPKGTVMTASFELDGQEFVALNGGPMFKFNESVSFVVNCDTQEEIDYYWQRLSEGGKEVQCGWLKDKFGLSWQIVPRILGELVSDSNPKRGEAVMQAIMKMVKLDIAALRMAYDQAV
jgi:predicted 3-demethylubiquinone-9 3-methyltransferase (glyoxalase superfamily)